MSEEVEKELARGLRLNSGKNQLQLLPANALEVIGWVMTHGAKKYAPENWRKGMPWSEVIASLKRHISLFEGCEDFDKETSLPHLAHAGANILFLLDYMKSNPQFDDRYKPYLNQKRIVLDIDEVLCDWQGGYRAYTGHELRANYWDCEYKTGKELQKLAEDKEFWVNLPKLRQPDFVPHAYVSSRGVPVEWTEEWIEKNDLPCRPVIHVPFGASKVEELKKLNTEIFIDDRFENFAEAMRAGICTFLMDAKHNKFYNVGFRRIFDLQINNIVR